MTDRTLEIPGTMYYRNGRFVFTPSAGAVGYFGPEFVDFETGEEFAGDDAEPVWVELRPKIAAGPILVWEE